MCTNNCHLPPATPPLEDTSAYRIISVSFRKPISDVFCIRLDRGQDFIHEILGNVARPLNRDLEKLTYRDSTVCTMFHRYNSVRLGKHARIAELVAHREEASYIFFLIITKYPLSRTFIFLPLKRAPSPRNFHRAFPLALSSSLPAALFFCHLRIPQKKKKETKQNTDNGRRPILSRTRIPVIKYPRERFARAVNLAALSYPDDILILLTPVAIPHFRH